MTEADSKIRRTNRQAYQCGDETRSRIIEAAIDVFATQGFRAATTRQIATQAGVNTPALQYYFENKEGLYHACAEQITQHASDYFSPVLEQIEGAVHDSTSQADAIGLFCKLQDAIVDRLLTCGSLDDPKRLFMSMAQTGQGLECGFRLMRERVADKIDACAQRLVSIASGLPASDPLVKVKAMTLLGQTLIFHVGRQYTQATLNWAHITDTEINLLKTVLRDQTSASLAFDFNQSAVQPKTASDGIYQASLTHKPTIVLAPAQPQNTLAKPLDVTKTRDAIRRAVAETSVVLEKNQASRVVPRESLDRSHGPIRWD